MIQTKKQVLFDHDGSADDFLSLMLLLSMRDINLLGVSMIPADCYSENALETTLKILSLFGKTQLPVGIGNFNGINAFPADWRAKPKILNALPSLINVDTSFGDALVEESKNMITKAILTAAAPVTVVMTGPCTNLVQAIDHHPGIVEKIAEIIWMAGALDTEGNVRTYNHDGSAEWNVFWDPVSSDKLLKYRLPLTIVPLDVTNHVPVTIAFLKQLALESSCFCANLAGQFWATTIDTIPAYEYTYFMWDVLATSYLAIPGAFTVEKTELAVSAAGPSAGRTVRIPDSNQWVNVVKHVDRAYFYQYVLNQFKSNPAR